MRNDPTMLTAVARPQNEAERRADRLLESIAFKAYSSDDNPIRDAAAMLRRLGAQGWQKIGSAPRDGSWFFTRTPGSDYPYDVARFDPKLDEFVKAGCGFQYVSDWRPAEGGVVIGEQRLTADTIVRVNAFLTHMADHYRQRTRVRWFGITFRQMSREDAMLLALATFDASLDIIGVAFGDPEYGWDRDHAQELVDDDLQHWEAE
jgi:hypothetical protein